MFLIMSVEPGFGGQAFIPESLDKIKELRNLLNARGIQADIEVDGGIYHSNVKEVLNAGANVIVAGSAVFKGNVAENVKGFMEILSANE
jgi:ribulose-phosphate 3-epimerase